MTPRPAKTIRAALRRTQSLVGLAEHHGVAELRRDAQRARSNLAIVNRYADRLTFKTAAQDVA